MQRLTGGQNGSKDIDSSARELPGCRGTGLPRDIQVLMRERGHKDGRKGGRGTGGGAGGGSNGRKRSDAAAGHRGEEGKHNCRPSNVKPYYTPN